MEALTYEQILTLFKQNSEQFAEVKLLFVETEKQIKALSAETDKQIKALSAETDKQIKALSAETTKTTQQIKNLSKQVGEITDTMGRFAEEQVRPKILELFRQRGIELEETHMHVRVEKDGKFFLEIDMLLVNTTYCVVVEVKNTLRHKDIDNHLLRLAKLKQTPGRTIQGTTMYGAVAGMIINEEVEHYAAKNGLFILKPKGDDIEIRNTSGFKPRTWQVEDK